MIREGAITSESGQRRSHLGGACLDAGAVDRDNATNHEGRTGLLRRRGALADGSLGGSAGAAEASAYAKSHAL